MGYIKLIQSPYLQLFFFCMVLSSFASITGKAAAALIRLLPCWTASVVLWKRRSFRSISAVMRSSGPQAAGGNVAGLGLEYWNGR